MKKILAIVLAVVMLLPVFAVNVFAAQNLVITSSSSSTRITLKLDEVVAKGESVTIHLAGTTDGAFRFCLSDAASKGSNWNQSPMEIVTVANGKIVDGAFDVTAEITADSDAQYLLISSGSWQFGDEDAFTKLVVSTVESNGTAVDLSTLNTDWGSGKVVEEVVDEYVDVVAYEYDCGEDGKAQTSWSDLGVNAANFANAIAKDGAKLVVEAEVTGTWAQLQLQATGWKAFKIADLSTGTIEISAESILEALQALDSSFEFEDIIQVCTNSDGVTIKSFKVIVTTVLKEAKKSGSAAFVYINEDYHAYRFRDLFIPAPHTDDGTGHCRFCREEIPTDVEESDTSVYVLTKTGGQDFESDATIANGILLEDTVEASGNCRIATSWKSNGTAWNGLTKAIPTEDAWLKITYTGTINSIIFQTENTSSPEAFEITTPNVVEEGETNVAWFNCADIVANSPVGLSGNFGGWANFMINFEGETTVYGIEVVIPLNEPGTATNVEPA